LNIRIKSRMSTWAKPRIRRRRSVGNVNTPLGGDVAIGISHEKMLKRYKLWLLGCVENANPSDSGGLGRCCN